MKICSTVTCGSKIPRPNLLPPTRATKPDQGWAYRHNMWLEFTKVRKPSQVITAFNSRVRDECLNKHVFFSLEDTRTKIDDWDCRYNNINAIRGS